MFKRIMAPVDLAHVDRLRRALDCAADLARHFGAELTYVGVTSTTPGRIARNPEEYAAKLGAFADDEGQQQGMKTRSHAVVAHDPTIEIDEALLRATGETDADLVVMASHAPDVMDYIWPSNGGKLAEHAKCSVMVVRP